MFPFDDLIMVFPWGKLYSNILQAGTTELPYPPHKNSRGEDTENML